MTPTRLDIATVQRRLRHLRDVLDHLEELAGVTPQGLDDDPLKRAAAERLLQVIVDLAVDVNGHLVVALTGRAPETGRASFGDVAACGVITDALAERLAPSAGLRDVLVHQYIDIRTDLVAESIEAAREQFPLYIAAVAEFCLENGDGT